jgi:integrase
MDRDQLDQLVSSYLDLKLDDVEGRIAESLPVMDGAARDAHEMHLADELERLSDALDTGGHVALFDIAKGMLPSGSDAAIMILARRLLEAQLSAVQTEYNALHGRPMDRWKRAHAAPNAPATPAPVPGMPLSELVAGYVSFQREGKAWSPKTDKSVTGILSALVQLIGDKRVSDVTKDDMRALRTTLSRVPTNSVKRYRGLTLLEAADKSDVEGKADRLSAKSKNMYISWLRTLWKWASEHDYVTSNPTVVLKEFDEARERDQRLAMSDEHVAALLAKIEPDKLSVPVCWWVPRVMLATGLRLEEAAKLRPCDIQQTDGVWFLDINEEAGRLKTAQSVRTLPIHSKLLPLLQAHAALVERKAGAKGNLWGLELDATGRWSEALSKRLNKRLRAAGVTDKRVVMESARNRFASELHSAGVDELTIAELMGHKGGETMSGRRYINAAVLSKLAAAVEKLRLTL